MTVRQKVILVLAVLALAAIVTFFIWYLRKPERTPGGTLVYREAYMRIADQPWQGERLCREK